jgi:HK97 family phage major capsid protein/HK97 family phage prohead protease
MKLKPQQRFVTLEPSGVNLEARTVELSFSSETRVPRFYGTEILSHKRGAANLDRLNNGAPLLFNHNMDDVIGVVENASIGDDKRGHAKVRFANTPRGNEVLGMVQDKILRNVSFMYSVDDIDDSTPGDFLVTSWAGMEISICTVPADASVGIGRSAERFVEHDVRVASETIAEATRVASEAIAEAAKRTLEQEAAIKLLADKEVERVAAEAKAKADADEAALAATNIHSPKEKSMTPEQIEAARLAALATAGTDSASLERVRIKAINTLATRHKIDPAQAEAWIDQGLSDAQVGVEILGVLDVRAQREVKTKSLAELGLTQDETKRFSMFRAINAALTGDWKKAGLELECHQEILKRTNDQNLNARTFYVPYEVQSRQQMLAKRAPLDIVGGGANGAFLVETLNQGFIELVRNSSVLLKAGATRMSGLQGNITIPKQTGAATAYWLADDQTSITESEQTFGQLALTPHNVGAYTTISRQLMMQSSPSAEGIVMADLAKVTALAVDKAGINGSGAAGQPTGILNATGVAAVLGTTASYATLISFQTDLAAANLLAAGCAYVGTPAIAALLMGRNRFANTDTPLWAGNMLTGQVGGFGAFSSNQIPAAGLIFGDFGQVILAEWGVLAVEVNPYAIFQAGIIGVRAITSIDIGVRYGAAFGFAAAVT